MTELDEYVAKIDAELAEQYKDLNDESVGMIFVDMKDLFSSVKSDALDVATDSMNTHYQAVELEKKLMEIEKKYYALKYWIKTKSKESKA